VSFGSITLCVASHRAFIVVVVVVDFIIDSVRKLLDTPSFLSTPSFMYPPSFKCALIYFFYFLYVL
jgi:hypothetical protein